MSDLQMPALTDATISNLQPVRRVESEQGLGSFLQRILPAVSNEIDKGRLAEAEREKKAKEAYDKMVEDNSAKAIALGRNDQLNNVHRQVSAIDAENYNYGHNYQRVVNGQAALAKDFQARLNDLNNAGADPAAFHALTQEYSKNTVDNIFNADLSTELKEQLYQAQLKENAAYLTQVNARMQKLAVDSTYDSRTKLAASLADQLVQGSSSNPETNATLVESYLEKMIYGAMGADPTLSLEDARTDALSQLSGVFDFVLQGVDVTGADASDIAIAEGMMNLADHLVNVDLGLANDVRTKAFMLYDDIQKHNGLQVGVELEDIFSQWRIDPHSMTQEQFDEIDEKLKTDPQLSTEAKARYRGDLLVHYANGTIAQLADVEEAGATYYDTATAARAAGMSPDTWRTGIIEAELNNAGDPFTAGINIIQRGNGQEYDAGLIKSGSEIIFNGLLGYVTMGDADVQNDPYADTRRQNFIALSKMYNTFKSQNVSKASDILSGLDAEYVDAFATVLENGGTLEQVREAFKTNTSASMAARYTGLDKAITSLTAKDLGLQGGEIMGNPISGTRTRNLPDVLEDDYVAFVQDAIKSSSATLAPHVPSGSKIALVSAVKRNGLFLQSEAGYSAAILNARTAETFRNAKVEGTQTPIGNHYLSKAIDAKREMYAETYGVNADSVIVSPDDTGNGLYFYVYDIARTAFGRRNGEVTLKNPNRTGVTAGGLVSTATIIQSASKMYKDDSKTNNTSGLKAWLKDNILGDNKQTTNNYQFSVGGRRTLNNRMVGRAVVENLDEDRKKYNVKVSGSYAMAMGGNTALATRYLNHLGRVEGFVAKERAVKDANTGKISHVKAMGITRATAKHFDKEYKTNFYKRLKSTRDPQKLMDIQGDFYYTFYKQDSNIDADLKYASIPRPTASPYPKKWEKSLMLVYDVAWHGGNGALYGVKGNKRGLLHAMNAPTFAKGLRKMKSLAVWNRENPNSLRNTFMVDALKSHFKARGKL